MARSTSTYNCSLLGFNFLLSLFLGSLLLGNLLCQRNLLSKGREFLLGLFFFVRLLPVIFNIVFDVFVIPLLLLGDGNLELLFFLCKILLEIWYIVRYAECLPQSLIVVLRRLISVDKTVSARNGARNFQVNAEWLTDGQSDSCFPVNDTGVMIPRPISCTCWIARGSSRRNLSSCRILLDQKPILTEYVYGRTRIYTSLPTMAKGKPATTGKTRVGSPVTSPPLSWQWLRPTVNGESVAKSTHQIGGQENSKMDTAHYGVLGSMKQNLQEMFLPVG